MLEIINDFGYDGCDIFKVAVSDDRSKLENLIEVIKAELIDKKKKYSKLEEDMNTKWSHLRVTTGMRSQDEINDLQCLTKELFKSFKTLTKYKLEGVNYYSDNSDFQITEIEVI